MGGQLSWFPEETGCIRGTWPFLLSETGSVWIFHCRIFLRIRLSRAEFLSGIKKNDKLYPVTTIVFYHGNEQYDGCTNLHDMLDFKEKNEIFRQYTSNYHINLVT